MGLPDATGEKLTIKIREKDHTLSPLTIADLAEFEQYVKQQKIKLIQDTISNKEDRIELLKEVIVNDLKEKEVANEMGSLSGVIYLLWKSLKDSKLSIDEVGNLVGVDNLDEVGNIITGMVGNIEKKK